MSADCNSNIERMNLRALVFLCILLLCMQGIEGAVSKYDPNSTDEADDPEPDKDTFEYPPLTCDEPIEIKGPAGAALVCPDHKKTFLDFKSYDEHDISPPWSYSGLNGPKEWHKIDPLLFNTDYDPDLQGSLQKKLTRAPAKQDDGSSGNQSSSSNDLPPVPGYYGSVPSFMRLGGHLPENFCDGPTPSPIVIDQSKAKLVDSLSDFEYINFARNFSIQMYFPEDGTDLLTVRTIYSWGVNLAPCISKGSVVGGDLCFDRLIIHYGTDGKTGAEHQFANKTFPMELQFFFTLQAEEIRTASEFFYVHLQEYLNSGPSDKNRIKGKLVQVLSVFVQVVDNIETEPNLRVLAEMAKEFWKANNKNNTRSFMLTSPVFNFAPLLPKSVYYTYRGSLSFPPCFPDLDYAIFEKPLNMSREDFESFLYIPSEFDDSGFVAGNYRPLKDIYVQLEDRLVNRDEGSRLQAIQARKNRVVHKSLPPEDKSKEALYDYYEDENNGVDGILTLSQSAAFVIYLGALVASKIFC